MDKKEEQGEKEEQSIVIVSKEKIPLTKLPRPENRRSSGVLGLIRAAPFLAQHHRSRRVSPKVSLWRAIVGSVRPLPLHQVQPQPQPQPLPPQNLDALHDVVPLQRSPLHPSALSPLLSAVAASEDAMSRYASAEDLREMDEDGEGGGGDGDGEDPNAIDLKAEEFIVRFYEQIRLQHLESIARCNNSKMIEHEMFDA